MAIVRENDLTEGLSGRFGKKIVFKQWKGRTIATRKARKPQKESALQRQNRDRFREATAYAKQCMADPKKKAYYLHKAKTLELSNAYTAAITDFMRKPEVKAIDRSKHSDKRGSTYVVDVVKKGFAVKEANVVMMSEEDVVLETAPLVRSDGRWIYKQGVVPGKAVGKIKLLITARDYVNNVGSGEFWV